MSQVTESKDLKKVLNKTIESTQEESIFQDGKLYGLYCVISHKTVRTHEKHLVKYYKKNKTCKGYLCKTGRGYFIDGYEVDRKAVQDWAAMNDGLVPFRSRK